jgi:hypothetical protein
MKRYLTILSTGAAFAITLLSANCSQAADLPVVRTAKPSVVIVRPRVRTRHLTVRHRYALKSIGMFCTLPPDVIVARNWNGPQCRYVDNIILPPARVVFSDR